MRRRNWLVPVLWAVGGGVVGYLLVASTGIGASPYFEVVGEGQQPKQDIFAIRAARHRLVGLASCGVGLAAGLVIARLRSRWVGAVVGGLAGVAIGFGPYWDIGQPEGVPLDLAKGSLLPIGVLGLLLGFASVRRPTPISSSA